MLLVASETGHVYTFATRKLQPMITSDAGKALIQTCLNSPDPMPPGSVQNGDQRMSATGYEETELTYNIAAAADEEQQQKVRQMMYNSHHAAAAAAHHHAYSPASSVAAAALFTPHSSATGLNSMGGHSPYGAHPAPSPSPASSAYGGGMSLSPGPTSHHSPPFATPHSQRWLAASDEAWILPSSVASYHHTPWFKAPPTPTPSDDIFQDAEDDGSGSAAAAAAAAVAAAAVSSSGWAVGVNENGVSPPLWRRTSSCATRFVHLCASRVNATQLIFFVMV